MLVAAPLAGQGMLTAAGRVVAFRGADTVGVPGVRVTLHAIGNASQGAVDSALSGPGGGFRFRRTGDTAVVYLLSARFAGIEYFGEPMRLPGAATVLLAVADTSSTAPVTVAARHVIIRRPDSTGARPVLDVFSIRNAGTVTRVAPDTTLPTATVLIPPGVLDARVEEGDLSGAAVEFRGDTLLVFAPLPPGTKDVMLAYRLPPGSRATAWQAPADSFDILTEEDRDVTASGAGLKPTAAVELLGVPLQRWSAIPPDSGTGTVQFGSNSSPGTQQAALLALVTLLGLGVVVGSVAAFRRRQAVAPVQGTRRPDDPIEALARLDAQFAGRRGEVPDAEWTAYEAERARFKAAAEAALAGGSPRR